MPSEKPSLAPMTRPPTLSSVAVVMDSQRMRVAVGVDPFVLRTAVHEVLVLDGRFEAILLPETDDLAREAEAAQAVLLLVTRQMEKSNLPVARLSEGLRTVEITESGTAPRTIPFEGLPSLAELLVGLGPDREEENPNTFRL
jgi:hypothetical protein